jgi:uncharacterized membrane-anchored protein
MLKKIYTIHEKDFMPTLAKLYFILLCCFVPPLLAQENAPSELSEQQYAEWSQALWASIERQTGEIQLANQVATLTVPESFYYLNKQDSKKVLEEIWGNPPGNRVALLGMLFPADTTPFDSDSWGVTIEYEQDGYVSDEDAADLNYDELLIQMQEDTALTSEARVEKGYVPIKLVGWAAKPYYDATSNKLHWAKEIQFGDAPVNTLNYNIRVLGRQGVLVLNFIAGMDQLPQISTNLDNVLAMAEFNQGSRYADFDPELDDVAAYGIGALVAGKVLAKTGLLAAAFLFLKKFGIILLVAVGTLVKKVFWRKNKTNNS